MWLALQLKHRQLCDIKLPEWLRDQDLNNLHQAEDASRKRNQLEQVDFHYQETAALLFRHSPDSFYGTSPRPLPSICNNTVGNRPTPFGGGLRSVPLCFLVPSSATRLEIATCSCLLSPHGFGRVSTRGCVDQALNAY